MAFPATQPIPNQEDTSAPIATEDGKLNLSNRVKDVPSAASLYQQMWQDDYISNYNRSLVDSAIDGGPPKAPNGQGAWGQGGGVGGGGINQNETNINWGDAEEAFHKECAPDNDLVFSPEVIGSTPLKRSYLDEETRQDKEEVIAEEITATIRDWDLFVTTKQCEILERKKHGVAAIYWMDENDWRWDTAGLEMFKMPRPTRIGVGNLPYCGIRCDMNPELLYEKIRDPELAKAAGWNVPAVKRALIRAAPMNPISDDFEAWERYWKNNDYMMSYSKAVCPLVFMPVKELNGSITALLFNWDGSDEFLYQKKDCFGGMERFCQIYIDNVGTNKYYHAIRGFGTRIYSVAQMVNRMTNQFADQVMQSGMLIFSPPSESDADEAAYMQSANYLILNPGWIQSPVKMPDLQNSTMPGLSVFTERMARVGGKIGSGNSALTPDGKTSKHMFNAQLEQMAMGSDANLENYLSTYERHFREVVRRMTRPNYLPKEPGGEAIAEMHKRCLERGVTSKDIENVDWKRCKINRGVGAGSAAARVLAYDRMQGLRGNMTPDKQELFDRKNTIAIAGIQMADEFFPKPKNRRLPPAADYADVSNNQLMEGKEVPVRDGQNQVVIARIRLEKLQELNQQVKQGGEAALDQVVVPMHYLLEDMQARLEKANPQDPSVKEMEDDAGQFNELVTNGLRHLKSKQDKMQAEMAHNAGKVGDQQVGPQGQNGSGSAPQGGGGAPQGPDLSKAIEKSMELEFKIKLNQLKIAGQQAKNTAEAQKAAQQMTIADLQAASDIHRSRFS